MAVSLARLPVLGSNDKSILYWYYLVCGAGFCVDVTFES